MAASPELMALNTLAATGLVTVEQLKNYTGVSLAALDRAQLPIAQLDPREEDAVKRVFYYGVAHLKKVAPSVAIDIERQYRLALAMAAVAKGLFPAKKNYTFPSVPGQLGVAWLFPQAIKYSATAATGYAANSWDISVTAGTKAYLLGSDAAFYKACSDTDSRSLILIFENGLVEVGSTPSAQQFRLVTESKGDYGAYAVEPLVEVSVEPNKAIYQYPTPLGALWVDYNTGVKWYFMPTRTGTATIKMLGLVYFEHNFLSDAKWV
ncbi:MAG: hypothetical protein LM580_07225 [Thermofilum sp.]|nr:hypothetical protein [Thermofilum sp.]